ncbi:OmpA family protein [Sulfurivirga sp.]|uniref:OmpA family protein n=1 Tax=Sulfurivirga sp. TaxID=2614236 RepID=UPI0025FD34E3|nr:OmpA family protein [Sulfurivirga sp.]
MVRLWTRTRQWSLAALLLCALAAQAQPDTPARITLEKPLPPKTLKRYYTDLDRDGVVDMLDECPNTPAGVAVDVIGCARDEDVDGVPDFIDQCPQTRHAGVNFLGCNPDTDRDGVPDPADRCPDTPLGQKVNRFGCIEQVNIQLHLTFDTAKYRIRPDMAAKLREALTRLKELDSDHVLLIEGHTDAIGCRDDNLKLSWNRAQAVRDYLVRALGLPAEQVYVVGYGEARPVADNHDPQARARNRRIELRVVARDRLPPEARPQMPENMQGYVPHPGRCPLPDAR